MNRAKVEINELRVCVSGLTQVEGQRLGKLVAKNLTALSVGTHQQRTIPRVSIRLQRKQNHSPEHLAQAIALKISSCIGMR